MNPQQLSEHIITPVLLNMNAYSKEAHDLLLGTALHESNQLNRITQYGYNSENPDDRLAFSYYQIELNTLWDLYDSYLNFRPGKRAMLDNYAIPSLKKKENLIMNPAYATAAARLQYYRKKGDIPDTLEGQAEYWKTHWNTIHGKGTVQEYVNNVKDHHKLLKCKKG